MKSLNLDDSFELQDIKKEPMTESQVEQMKELSGSYESLFSKRAMKYKSMGLKDKNLSESDIKKLIVDEYTFLSRPVFIIDNKIFIGNSAKNVEAVKEALANV
jgi:arsenate reductase